ncbi:substrate-binding domain-containing protein [Amycolatopsis sp. CA-161197]|uniref:substrate-binding domain-containing protein n=1 Tax=Amycolatopsis sp. CA-161197 TaxID=3239922 RepID=UPI003D91F1F5
MIRHQHARAIFGGLGAVLLLAACSPGLPQSTATASGGGTSIETLLAPADSVRVDAKPGPPVVGPINHTAFSLPYAGFLPLPDGPVGDPNRQYTICFSQADSVGSWAVAQRESAMVEQARHPNLKVLYYNTNNDPLKQVADVDSCLAQHVDAVVIWPHSVEPLTPEIEKVAQSGTVLVGMERTVATSDYSSWIYLDNVAATKDLALAVGKSMGGKGTVVETDGAIGSSPQILRRDGFVKALNEAYPEITVDFTAPTDYSRNQGYKVALDYLQAHPGKKIGAWYSQFSEIGYGVHQALADYNQASSVPQYTIVDGRTADQAVAGGTFQALAPWNPLHGDLAIRAAIYHLTGKQVPKNLLLQQPPLVTRQNAAEQLAATWVG